MIVKDCIEDELLQKIKQQQLFSRYFGPSLRQRVNTCHWFENRFIRAALRDTGWIEKHERLLREADIATVDNSDEIFSGLDGHDPDYDLKIFDVLAEVRLIRWARDNGYSNIEKLVPGTQSTPDFLMRNGEILTIAEAKHFRERDFLPEFVEDRLIGLVLKTRCLNQFGIFAHTTQKYDQEREKLLRTRLESEHQYRDSVREELTEEWLKRLEVSLAEHPEHETEIVNGLFVVSRSEAPYDVGVGWGLSTHGVELMLEKLGGNLMKALQQIRTFIDGNPLGKVPIKALVFLSGTDPTRIEWDDMWQALYEADSGTSWEQVERIHKEASQLVGVPVQLIVGKGSPVRYVSFPWTRQG